MATHTRRRSIESIERDAKAVDLRRRHLTYRQIAEQLGMGRRPARTKQRSAGSRMRSRNRPKRPGRWRGSGKMSAIRRPALNVVS